MEDKMAKVSILMPACNVEKFIRECKKCNTIFLYNELDEEMVQPPAIAYTIQCPICKDKYVTRNYYKNGEIAFDHRKLLSLDGE